MTITFADEGAMSGQSAGGAPEICVEGFPSTVDENAVGQVLGQYGAVVSVARALPQHGLPHGGYILKMVDPKEAKWLVENLNRNIPVGVNFPVYLEFAETASWDPS